MRFVAICVICFSCVLVLPSCKEKPRNYSVKNVTGSLTNDEIRTCLGALGLSVSRFTIDIPERSAVKFTTEKFEKGTSIGSAGTMTADLDSGRRKFVLCINQQDGQKILRLNSPSAAAAFSIGDLKSYTLMTYSVIPVKKLTKQRQPIFYYTANSTGKESHTFKTVGSNIKVLANKHDFTMIIYAQLVEQPRATTR